MFRAELAKGVDPAAARDAAWARLGSEDTLVQSVLERPELRSTAARFPALLFGAAPFLTWIGAPIAIAAALSLLPEALRRAPPAADVVTALSVLFLAHARLLPVLLGTLLLTAAARRRLRARWPLAGASAVDLLAGTLALHVSPGQLGVSSSLLPVLLPFAGAFGPKDWTALGEGLLRAAFMLALSLVCQRIARRLRRPDGLTPAAG